MRISATATMLAILFCAPVVLAQDTKSERAGRYSLQPVDGGGVIRLDTETGALAHCNTQDNRVVCEPVSVAESSKDGERLLRENAELKADIKRLEDLLANPPTADNRQVRRSPKFEIPSEQDVDKAFDYMERMFKKFRDRMKTLDGRERGTL